MSKEYTISNKDISLTVSDHGAEIRSLQNNGKELMWQADAAFWGRTSPVLFPLVGNYWEKKSRYNGQVYEMSQHGFARDMDFALVKETEDSLLFELRESEETFKKYPFPFILQLGYVLKGKEVEVQWIVKNPSDKDMFFSVGGHPAFNCDLNKSSLRFSKNGKLVADSVIAGIIEGDGSGCLSDSTKALSLNEGLLAMSDELFEEDALIIEDRQADEVTLVDEKGEDVLTVKFDSPLFGIWSPAGKKAPFVCIEPWYGRCDRVGFSEEIDKREYGNTLHAGEEFKVSYTIAVK